MWYLHCLNESIIYLWEKDNYSVGRKNKDIIIENDDSISRNHGLFKIKDNDLYVTDLGSKYGTFVGTVKLQENEEKKLSVNEVITFGLLQNNQSKFKVKYFDFKVVLSNVKSNEKHEQYTALETLKGTRTSTWDKFCTHLVVSEVILTSKVLCALTIGQQIVNVNFFPDYVKAVKSNSKPPKEADYVPVFNETLLNKNVKLEFLPDRKTLFKDLIFVFLTEKCKKSLEELITTTGGNVISWQKQEFGIDKLKRQVQRYLFIEDHSEDINKESVIYKSFQEAIKFMQLTGRRFIPLQEIALAIIYNSREENCNPLFNRAALLVPERTQEQQSEIILAYDTEHSSNSKSQSEKLNLSNQEIPSVVEPSFETEISISSKDSTGIKRPLEVDITACSDGDKTSNKKTKEDQPVQSTSTQFSFRRPYNQSAQSVKQVKIDKFLFSNKNTSTKIDAPKATQSTNTKTDDVSEIISNPFSRKRKASNNLNSETKKRPLVNISNLQIEKTKVNTSVTTEKPKEADKNNEENRNVVAVKKSNVIKCEATMFSTSWIKKDISFDENVKIKKEEAADEEIAKLNEIFKDSIIIEFCTIVPPRNKNITSQNNNSISAKNFKKFKKIHLNIQSEIICDVSKVVIGEENICPPDEDENDDDDMDDLHTTFYSANNTRSRPQQQQTRRRFQFCT